MSQAIGGYLELELRHGEHYHSEALRLNTARCCFEYILCARNYQKVYMPYYTCGVMLKPLQKLHIAYEFYHVNVLLEPERDVVLQPDEAFLYTNYYGLKQATVERLAKQYGEQLIVDNAQAFFAKPVAGIDTFYSVRKFFGVPDGAYLYTSCCLSGDMEQEQSFERMKHLLKRIEISAEAGFADFQLNDADLANVPIRRMSRLTERLLENIDYMEIARRRRENYFLLQQCLVQKNAIYLPLGEDMVPMAYPYLTMDCTLRQHLIQHRIYVATYWQNVIQWCEPDSRESLLAHNMIPLPIDQRYEKKDMNRIIKYLCE